MIVTLVLILPPLLLIDGDVFAGSSLANVSSVLEIIAVKNKEEMDRIIEQIIEARRASQRALSPEEIEKIRQQAQAVLAAQKADLETAGAMVFASCQIIE